MDWITNNIEVVTAALRQHVALTWPAIALSLMLCIPIAWFSYRKRRTGAVVVNTAALLYTIPSLPLFLMLPVILGTGRRSPINITIALTLYGIAILIPVAVSALRELPQPVIDAAIALGHSPTRLFLNAELPLAGPTILAGLRVVAASTISLATLGSVLGVAGIGSLFVDGFKRGIQAEIIAGLILTVLLALITDILLIIGGRIAMPWTRRSRIQPTKPKTAVATRVSP